MNIFFTMQYIGSILTFAVVTPAHGSETELKIAPPLSLALSLDCWVCIDRISISIRPPTAIAGTSSRLSIRPPPLRPLFLCSLSPLAICHSTLSPLFLSNGLIVAFTLSLSPLSIYLCSLLPPQHIQCCDDDDDNHDDGNNDNREGGAGGLVGEMVIGDAP